MRTLSRIPLAALLCVLVSSGCAKRTEQGALPPADTTAIDTSLGSTRVGGAAAESAEVGSAAGESTGGAGQSQADTSSLPPSTGRSGSGGAPVGGSRVTWRQIDAERAALQAAVAGNTLGLVRGHAIAIRDLFATLPSRSPELTQAARTRLKEMAATVAAEVQRLNRAADAGDLTQARAELRKLESTLASARALYTQ